jgi:hypothetical protein
MSYVNFRSTLKKVNLKPKGLTEITLEVDSSKLDGQLNSLSQMVDCPVDTALESSVVNFNVSINTQTDRPVTEYKVDEDGVVSEVKPEHEQLKADGDLGIPPEKIPTKEEKERTEREVIDQFIVEGLSPTYEDLRYDFREIIQRHMEGVSYLKIASDLELSSGKLSEALDEYRKRVAPLAQKWWEWKQEKDAEYPEPDDSEYDPETTEAAAEEENEDSSYDDQGKDDNKDDDEDSEGVA